MKNKLTFVELLKLARTLKKDLLSTRAERLRILGGLIIGAQSYYVEE